MKTIHYKLAVIAAILLAFKTTSNHCGPYNPLMKEDCEVFIGNGKVAVDQNLGNYISMGTIPYTCLTSTWVCAPTTLIQWATSLSNAKKVS